MIKGWNVQNGNTYYFDPVTGAMAKGEAEINGLKYCFDMSTGIMQTSQEVPAIVGGNVALEDLQYKERADGTVCIKRYVGSVSDVILPSYINGKAVTELDLGGGRDCDNILSITVPDTVTQCCFNNFRKLEVVNFGTGMTDFQYQVFTYCDAVKEINVSSAVKNFDENWCLTTNKFQNAVLNIYTSPDKVTLNNSVTLERLSKYWESYGLELKDILNNPGGGQYTETNHFSQINFIY